MILEDDESYTPNAEATAKPNRPTNPSVHGPWRDIKNGSYVDDDLHPIPPLLIPGVGEQATTDAGRSSSRNLKRQREALDSYNASDIGLVDLSRESRSDFQFTRA